MTSANEIIFTVRYLVNEGLLARLLHIMEAQMPNVQILPML